MQKVAVIIPAFNAENYIERALNSVLSQTRMPDEVIVVDDGSADATANIARRHALNATGILKVISKRNEGVAVARNKGILATGCDWVAPLDADDVLMPNHLHDLMEQVEASSSLQNVGLVFGFGERFFDSLKTESESRSLPDFRKVSLSLRGEQLGPNLYEVKRAVISQLLTGNFIPTCGSVFRRVHNGTPRLYDEQLRYCEDRDFYLRIALSSNILFFDKLVCMIYRHTGNASAYSNSYATTKAAIMLLHKFINTNNEISLTDHECEAARFELNKTIGAFFYSASVLGIREYCKAVKFLQRSSDLYSCVRFKDLIRAGYYTFKS